MTQLIKFFRRRRWMNSTTIVVAPGNTVGAPSSSYAPTYYFLGF
jgi:hypothetical protein